MDPKPSFKLEAPAVTPEQQEQIRKIENLLLPADDRVDLVLLVLKEKEATDIGSVGAFCRTDEEAAQYLMGKRPEVESKAALVRAAGLQAEIESFKIGDESGMTAGLNINAARDLATIEKLKAADKAKDHKTMGRLYGFPTTAVDWFSGLREDEFFPERKKEMEEVIKIEGLREFLEFTPSPDHWREELEIVRRRRDMIKKYAPSLYSELMAPRSEIPGGGH